MGEEHNESHEATRLRGEAHGSAKLTTEQVIEIRKRYSVGGISLEQLGGNYGVSTSLISLIVNRKLWAHLPSEVEVAA